MKAVRHFALIFAVFLPLVTPAMACVVPGTHLTSAERACCKQMASQCGNMKMPASHNCCSTELPAASSWNVAQLSTAHLQNSLNGTAGLPLIALLHIPTGLPSDAPQHTYTLPQSPPAAISVLRI